LASIFGFGTENAERGKGCREWERKVLGCHQRTGLFKLRCKERVRQVVGGLEEREKPKGKGRGGKFRTKKKAGGVCRSSWIAGGGGRLKQAPEMGSHKNNNERKE